MAGPDVIRCSYDGDRTVTAWWDSDTAPPVYNVTVFDNGAPLKSQSQTGSSGTVTLDRPLDPNNFGYTVAAAPGQGGNAYGAALPVIAARLTDLTATMRGEDALEVSWTLPSSLADGAQLRVVDAGNDSYGTGWIK